MKNETIVAGRNVGAVIGAILFLLVGIMPGFYFGGYGAITLLHKLTGAAVEPSLISRMIVVMGMLVGIACSSTVMIVLGGLAGTVLGYLTSSVTRRVHAVS